MSERRVVLEFSEGHPHRLDKYLAHALGEFSRSRIQSWIKAGRVVVSGQVVRKTGHSLDQPVTIEVTIPPTQPAALTPETIPLDVVYEDDDLLVVNKPAGMVVHPAPGHPSGTLVHAALAHAPAMEGVGGVRRPGVVHRLDRHTSGLILLAKNDSTHHWLQNQFRQRKVEKVYLALVDGRPPTPSGRVEASIGRDPGHRTRMAVVSPGKGRSAVTEYRTREAFPAHTYLEARPVTGRTHQIRVHLAFLGCPVAGDRVYGLRRPSLNLGRHFLHAWRLHFRLPDQSELTSFEAPLSPDLSAILAELSSLPGGT